MADDYLELTEDSARTRLLFNKRGAHAGQFDCDTEDDYYGASTKMTRARAAELVAWLTITHLLVDSDILPILRAEGYVLESRQAGNSDPPDEG